MKSITILKAIARSAMYQLSTVEKVYDVVESYDKTVEVLMTASENGSSVDMVLSQLELDKQIEIDNTINILVGEARDQTELEKIVTDWVNDNIGEESATAYVEQDSSITVSLLQMDKRKQGEEELKHINRHCADEFIDYLNRLGFVSYHIESITVQARYFTLYHKSK